MIDNTNEIDKGLESALKALEQAKARVANERKKQNDKRRKAENHHKYLMGGIVAKYFPKCYHFNEQEVQSIQYSRFKNAAVSVKNEVLEMIAKVRERKSRLDLPIVSGKHLRKISDRTSLQSADNAEKFITARKIDSFESLAKFMAYKERRYGQLETVHLSMFYI